jgi:hypothetical protein
MLTVGGLFVTADCRVTVRVIFVWFPDVSVAITVIVFDPTTNGTDVENELPVSVCATPLTVTDARAVSSVAVPATVCVVVALETVVLDAGVVTDREGGVVSVGGGGGGAVPAKYGSFAICFIAAMLLLMNVEDGATDGPRYPVPDGLTAVSSKYQK